MTVKYIFYNIFLNSGVFPWRSADWQNWFAHRRGRQWEEAQLQSSSSEVAAGDPGNGQRWWESGEVQADPAGARSTECRFACVCLPACLPWITWSLYA